MLLTACMGDTFAVVSCADAADASLRDRSEASKTARMAQDVITADILRWRQDDPQAQPRGIETTRSRFGCGIHLP